jgi:hypothetical protein
LEVFVMGIYFLDFRSKQEDCNDDEFPMRCWVLILGLDAEMWIPKLWKVLVGKLDSRMEDCL